MFSAKNWGGKLTCVGLYITVITNIFLESEARQVEILGDLYRIVLLPLVL